MGITGINTFLFFIIRHKVLLALSILMLLMSGVYLRAMAEPNTGWVECRDHYAIEIPQGEAFAGRYVRCEQFNRFQRLIESGDMAGAQKLTF